MDKELKKTRLIIFDLDGTLIDSAADIAASINAVLDKFGYKTLQESDIRKFIGDGVTYLLYRSILFAQGTCKEELIDKFPECPLPKEDFQNILSWYLEWYKANPVTKTVLYPGVRQLLETLKKIGYTLAVLSNKSVSISKEILKQLEVSAFFSLICGPEDTGTKKPDSRGIDNIINILNNGKEPGKAPFEKTEIMIVGDSKIDVLTGKNSGIKTCYVKAGYGNQEQTLKLKPDFTINETKDLIPVLG